MSECRDCRWWRARDSVTAKAAECNLLSGPGPLNTARRAMTTTPDMRYADVVTAHDFGCNDFAAKELQETVPK